MKINRTFIKGANWALAGLISLLGFTNCEKELSPSVEYGTPNADYTVKGKVVNKATGKAIEGIRVAYNPEVYSGTLYGVPTAPYKPKYYVITNAKGEYKLTEKLSISEIQFIGNSPLLPVYVEDIDGEKNGLFQSETIQVDFKSAEKTGKPKGWYDGEYTVTLNVEMTEINNK